MQYCAALMQPSWSTQMTLNLPPDACAAAAVPRPVPPATGMMMSAPWLLQRLVASDLPLAWSVKLLANRPFCLALSQPRTWTFLPC